MVGLRWRPGSHNDRVTDAAPTPPDDSTASTDVLTVDLVDSGDGTTGGDPLRRVPLARRWRLWWIAGAIVAVLAYVLVAVAYAADSREVDAAYVSPRFADSEVQVKLTPLTVDASVPRMTLQVEVNVARNMVDDKEALVRDLEVQVLPAGGASLTFAAGRVPDSRTVTVPLNGDIENWPFDDYDTQILVVAQSAADPGSTQPQDRVVGVQVAGVVQGWSASAGPSTSEAAGPGNPWDGVDVHFSRALAIKLFAGVLIAVMILMPVMLLAVAVPLYREQRLFEAGFLGYAAAMLFATVPLRNFFPGNPPAGSWVDVLVVLWVLVALIVGIGVAVLAFLRHPRGR